MSTKILVVTLDEKQVHRTRARAQRLVDQGTHRWDGPAMVREVLRPEKAQSFTLSDPARFLLPSFQFAYPDNLPNLDDTFQRALRYPVELAKDQRSPWADWTDLF